VSEILLRALLTLSLGSLLALPLVSVSEIGRGFFTLWVAIVELFGALGLVMRAGSAAAGAGAGALRDWTSIFLAACLLVLGVFWLVLRLGGAKAATACLVGSALLGGLALREIALSPQTTTPRRGGAAEDRTSGLGPVSRSIPDSRSIVSAPPETEKPEPAPSGALNGPLLATSSLLSALAVGLVSVAMVLGHWYLVQPKLTLAPLRRCCDALIGILLVRLIVSGWGFAESLRAGFRFLGGPDPVPWEVLILSQRLLFGFGGSLILAFMIRRTVALRSTMSATGLLYIAILFVWVGEFLAIYLGRLTGEALVV